MNLYRKRIQGNIEEYCTFDIDVAHNPKPSIGIIINLQDSNPPIPFLATHTPYRIIDSFTFFTRYRVVDDDTILCENGWEEITEEEYIYILKEIADYMRI